MNEYVEKEMRLMKRRKNFKLKYIERYMMMEQDKSSIKKILEQQNDWGSGKQNKTKTKMQNRNKNNKKKESE